MAQLKNTIINGDLTVNGNIDGVNFTEQLFKKIYPVGTLYWTNDKLFDPNKSFGGVWTRITDKFILAGNPAGNNLPVENATGKITLKVEELPNHTHNISHTHTFSGTSDDNGAHSHKKGTLTVDKGGEHTHDINDPGHKHKRGAPYDFKSGGAKGLLADLAEEPRGMFWTTNDKTNIKILSTNSSHSHTISGSTEGVGNHNHTYSGITDDSNKTISGPAGSGSEINIMPPYIVRYCWERNPDK